LDTQAPDTILD
jgi:hypothetical protein